MLPWKTRPNPTQRDVRVSTADLSRRHDGLALRVLRVGVHPEALVLRSGTDVSVRTPARPDHREGNALDVLTPPASGDVTARLESARRLMEPLGAPTVQVRYELPVDAEEDADRAAAFRAARCTHRRLRVFAGAVTALTTTGFPVPASVTIERLNDPDGDVIARRRWYAAAVLDRYAHGEDVSQWRAWDDAWGAWQRERVAALARLGRAEVWLASRHGMPVATVTLVDDQDGLVVVDQLVTHPAHRRRGIGLALLDAALRSLRGSTALEFVASAAPPDTAVEGLVGRVGMTPIGDVQVWSRPTSRQ